MLSPPPPPSDAHLPDAMITMPSMSVVVLNASTKREQGRRAREANKVRGRLPAPQQRRRAGGVWGGGGVPLDHPHRRGGGHLEVQPALQAQLAIQHRPRRRPSPLPARLKVGTMIKVRFDVPGVVVLQPGVRGSEVG